MSIGSHTNPSGHECVPLPNSHIFAHDVLAPVMRQTNPAAQPEPLPQGEPCLPVPSTAQNAPYVSDWHLYFGGITVG